MNDKEGVSEIEIRTQFLLIAQEFNVTVSNFKIKSIDSYDVPPLIQKCVNDNKNNIYVKLDSIISAYSFNVSNLKGMLNLENKHYKFKINEISCSNDNINLIVHGIEATP